MNAIDLLEEAIKVYQEADDTCTCHEKYPCNTARLVVMHNLVERALKELKHGTNNER